MVQASYRFYRLPFRQILAPVRLSGEMTTHGCTRVAGPRRSLEMHQMSGSIDSMLRLLDLADEGRFLLMSHM
jgi:hypothetical protein